MNFVDDLARDYANANDPWWADTAFVSPNLTVGLSSTDLVELRDSLERLGMRLVVDADMPRDQVAVERQNLGPWLEAAAR